MSTDSEPTAPKRFSEIIRSQIAGDNGECGARVRKNVVRNEQVGPHARPFRSTEPNDEELKPVVKKRVRKRGGPVEVIE